MAKKANKPAEVQALPTGYCPDLKKVYKEEIIPALMKQFSYSTVMQVPRLVKITVNEQENVVMLPLRLVQDPTGEPYVWTYKSFGKKLVKTNVTLGPAANGNVVISEGLSAGTPVVWEGDFTVFEDGMKVKAEEREQAPDAAPASTAAAE